MMNDGLRSHFKSDSTSVLKVVEWVCESKMV